MVRRSKGSLFYSEKIGDDICRYQLFTREHVCVADKSLKIVLHRAGSYQEYPTHLNAQRFYAGRKGSEIKNIIQLMDFGFEEVKAHGIEIDVRTVPKSPSFKSVYVVHDAIRETELDEKATTYLENNTLQQVLTHFLGKDYGGAASSGPQEQFIFIELKVPKRIFRLNSSPLNREEKEYVMQVISEADKAKLSAMEPKPVSSPRVAKRIAFVSFNLDALEFAMSLSDRGEQKGRQYFFIAGTNRRILGRLAAIFFLRQINYLTSSLTGRIKNAEWLTGIWVDPSGIRNMARTFKSINRGRRFPLDIYISTYKLKEKRFRKRFEMEVLKNRKGHSPQLENVQGLIFDIRKF
jgi:hypothetical protein